MLAAAPLNENFYAAMAARGGAIVTVEKIVSTGFIRRHAELVKLPGQYVAAVVEAPFGAHPAGMYGMNVPELEAYAEDLDFILGLRRAFRQPETAQAWIRLSDAALLADLRDFFRGWGCISVEATSDTIQVLLPGAPTEPQAELQIRTCLAAWLATHPGVEAEIIA